MNMAVPWSKIEKLPTHVQQRMQSLYTEQFPIEVRFVLSDWLDSMANVNDWEEMDPDYPHHENYLVHSILPAMVSEIKKKIASSGMDIKFRLSLGLQKIEDTINRDPFQMMRIVKQILAQEANVIREWESGLIPVAEDGIPVKPKNPVDERFEVLRTLRDELQRCLPLMKQEHETLVLAFNSFKKQQDTWTTSNFPPDQWAKITKEKDDWETNLRRKATNRMRNREIWLNKFDSFWAVCEELLHKVVDEDLEHWKREQQLGGNGAVCVAERGLPLLQTRCEALAETLWISYQQLQSFGDMCSDMELNSSNNPISKVTGNKDKVQNQLLRLIQRTFLIEKQPPQVMKTNTRFTATVRFLVGVKLNVHMSSPSVRVSIISEANAKAFLSSQKVESSGDILNNTGQLEYHTGSNQLTANFRNMQLKKIKRAEKKGTESVMDEKFALLFQSTFKIANGEFSYTVHALSLPVVVIVHGNQEPHAWATVTWDNAFAPLGRMPFHVPDKVPWVQVGQVLSTKFRSYTGRDLDADAQRFLAGKAFRNSAIPDYEHLLLTWAQFAKEALPDRNFTLWEWFYALLKVTKEHMRSLWNDGLIRGFISRKDTEELLLQCQPGTFLLRFSDTELGGVTIAWIGEGNDGMAEVYMLQPFTSRDFAIRALADRINDLPNLLYLYPNTPKDAVFSKYYTRLNDQQPLANGYVKHALALTLPGMSNGSVDFPNTPPSNLGFNPHSPESSSYQDPGSVPSVSNDYMANGNGASVPDDIMDLMGSMDFDINDLESILKPPQ